MPNVLNKNNFDLLRASAEALRAEYKSDLKAQVTSEVSGDVFVINLSGIIVSGVPFFFDNDDDFITTAAFREEFEKANGRDIIINLNSVGGDVFAGLEIYNLLESYAGKITTQVLGEAASMASVIFLAGDERLMAAATRLMIHRVSAGAYGNTIFMKKVSDIMSATDDALAGDIYAKKSNLTKAQSLTALTNETFYSVDDAIAAGLATGRIAPAEKEIENENETARLAAIAAAASDAPASTAGVIASPFLRARLNQASGSGRS